MAEYDASSIIVLDTIDAVRRRPGMYVGDVSTARGLWEMARFIVDRCLEEHRCGYGRRLRVDVEGGQMRIDWDGRPIAVGELESEHQGDRLILALTEGMHDSLIAATNALSESFEVITHFEGSRHRACFACGRIRRAPYRLGPSDRRGVTYTFTPDSEVFGVLEWDMEGLREALTIRAIVNPSLEVSLCGKDLSHPGGIEGQLAAGDGPVFESTAEAGETRLRFALRFGHPEAPTEIYGRHRRILDVAWAHLGLVDALRSADDRLIHVDVGALAEIVGQELAIVASIEHPGMRWFHDGAYHLQDPALERRLRALICAASSELFQGWRYAKLVEPCKKLLERALALANEDKPIAQRTQAPLWGAI